MKTLETMLALKAMIRHLDWLTRFFERIQSGVTMINEHWLTTGSTLEEVRQHAGNGPDVQAATAEWLRAALAASMKMLADTEVLAAHPTLEIELFIGENPRERLTPLDLATYEKYLTKATDVTPQALEELRRSYWALLIALMKRANEAEATGLAARLRNQIALAYWRGTRDVEDERGYRHTCRELGVDPGPAWTQTPQELLRV